MPPFYQKRTVLSGLWMRGPYFEIVIHIKIDFSCILLEVRSTKYSCHFDSKPAKPHPFLTFCSHKLLTFRRSENIKINGQRQSTHSCQSVRKNFELSGEVNLGSVQCLLGKKALQKRVYEVGMTPTSYVTW